MVLYTMSSLNNDKYFLILNEESQINKVQHKLHFNVLLGLTV